jgi:ribosomal protein S18 acetylase RimI-like enzyme
MEPQNHTIRRAIKADSAALALIGAATFLETYAHMIGSDDILAHAANKHSKSFYDSALADPHTKIWVAQTNTTAIIGYLVLGPATLPPASPDPDDLEIIRIYVLSRFQKSGLGHALLQHALAEAKQRKARRLVLGVYHGNEKALAFYARQGFEQIGTRHFSVGGAEFHDFVLGKNVLF